MNTPTDTLKSMGTQSKETVDLAAAKARDALDSAGKTADQAIDKVDDKVDDAKKGARKVIDKAAGVGEFVADKAKDHLGDTGSQVRDRIASYSDRVADYTAAEPVKAMLIAAAAGAVLMALLSMMVPSRERA